MEREPPPGVNSHGIEGTTQYSSQSDSGVASNSTHGRPLTGPQSSTASVVSRTGHESFPRTVPRLSAGGGDASNDSTCSASRSSESFFIGAGS